MPVGKGTIAVCPRCGAIKLRPMGLCPDCKFDPEASPENAAISVLLSDFSIDEEGEPIRKRDELLAMSERIKNREPLDFDKSELARLEEE